jgi:predicted transcriptional regulator YdeE
LLPVADATCPVEPAPVFRAEGEMPRTVNETWGAILGYFAKPSGDTRAFATDFEVYPAPGKIEIHISVR